MLAILFWHRMKRSEMSKQLLAKCHIECFVVELVRAERVEVDLAGLHDTYWVSPDGTIVDRILPGSPFIRFDPIALNPYDIIEMIGKPLTINVIGDSRKGIHKWFATIDVLPSLLILTQYHPAYRPSFPTSDSERLLSTFAASAVKDDL